MFIHQRKYFKYFVSIMLFWAHYLVGWLKMAFGKRRESKVFVTQMTASLSQAVFKGENINTWHSKYILAWYWEPWRTSGPSPLPGIWGAGTGGMKKALSRASWGQLTSLGSCIGNWPLWVLLSSSSPVWSLILSLGWGLLGLLPNPFNCVWIQPWTRNMGPLRSVHGA